MLKISIPEGEGYDETSKEFIKYPALELELEHSLVSMSKWESKWEIPYLTDDIKTNEQVLDYIACMVTNMDVTVKDLNRLSQSDADAISELIRKKSSATWFTEETTSGPSPVITTEVVYYWMIESGIPSEFETWPFNRLMTLIKVCFEKRKPEKKLSRAELADRNRKLNEERQKKYNTKG